MHPWLVLYRRNRSLVFRTSVLAAVVICGLLVFAPMPGSGAGRSVNVGRRAPAFAMLLSPYRLETAAFVTGYLAAFH
jgi:hypothetical protein